MATQADSAHILAVDDEPVVCQSLKTILHKEGFKVTTLEGGREAYDLICADPNNFDLLITDILMPDFSGIKLIESLRDQGIELPVLPMTGCTDDDNLGNMQKLGCRHILLKPFDSESLRRMIGRTLHGPGAELSLSDQIELAAQHFVMADLESKDDLLELSGQIASIQKLLDNDDVAAEVPVLADAEVLNACRNGAAEAVRILPKAFSGDGNEDSVDILGQTLATLQAVVCQGRAADHTHFPSCQTGLDTDGALLGLFADQQEEWLAEVRAELEAAGNRLDGTTVERLRGLFHRLAGDSGAVGFDTMADVCRQTMAALDERSGEVQPSDLARVTDWLEAAGVQACQGGCETIPEDLMAGLSTETEDSPSTDDDGSDGPAGMPTESGSSRAEVINCEVSLDPVQIEDPELGAAFVVEAREYFEAADENLLTLERQPDNTEALAIVMRAAHTLKGICGFLDIQPIEALAHATEELLETVAAGEEQFSGELNDLVFRSFDLLKVLVADVDAAMANDKIFHPRPEISQALQGIAQFLQVGGTSSIPVSAPAKDVQDGGGRAAPTTQSTGNGASQRATRVDSDKIDLLLDTIGELVIAESIVEKDPEIRRLGSVSTSRNIAHLGKITRQLQDLGLAMRMVPIRSTFRKMARLVRDLTRKADKQVEFVTDGEDTQIDREMVDKLIEPLVHLLRNAVDHGIEDDPEVRRKNGKPATGTVRLSACHSGGNINILIEDDGRGLNREAIAAKAVERGLIPSAEGLSDAEVFGLIFESGLSTAAKLTNVSGRGVGMDVVKSQIELLHGKILVESTPRTGSTFTLVLPLTTAIIDGMIIGVGSQQYILPVLSIIESFRPEPGQVSRVVGRGEIIRFRGKMLPLFRLSNLFKISDAVTDLQEAIAVVVEDSGGQTAILVDELVGQQQTVIKTLGGALPDTVGVSGVSIMADGTPGLILDIAGIVKLALSGTGNL